MTMVPRHLVDNSENSLEKAATVDDFSTAYALHYKLQTEITL